MRRPGTFARRIAVGFTASLVVAVAIATSTAIALRSAFSNDDGASVSRALHLAEVERLRRAFSEKVAGQRGYELSGDSGYLAEADLGRRQFLETLMDLRSHAVGEEELRSLEEASQAEEQHQLAFQELADARERGAGGDALEAPLVRLAETRKLTHEALDELAWLTELRLRKGARQAARAEQRALWLILAAAVLGLLVAMGLAWVLTRALWPLHHEARATEERFRLLVEGVKDYALYLLDPEGRVAS